MRIHPIRTRGIREDRAIVDLLELQELGLAPGMLTTPQLRDLWGVSQSQVSRRLAAIDRLGPWRVLTWQGCRDGFWLGPRPAPAVALPDPGPTARERWEALRLQWQEVGAC